MRVYYICERSVWEEPIDFGGVMLPRYNLFHPGVGSACIHLDANGDCFLVSTEFATDGAQETWHSHPEVARLPHPTNEGDVPVAQLHQNPKHARKQFKRHHWDLLVAKFGLNETHTVWDLHDRACAIDPLCRLSNTY
jgi:hypothetical protein